MKQNNSPQEIFEKIKEAKKIYLQLHNAPDGDSLGCCGAMKYFLERDFPEKEVILVSGDEVVEQFKKIPFVKEIKFGESLESVDLNDIDLFLFLDQGSLSYKGEKVDLPEGKVINIDHHNTNLYYGDLNYVDIQRPSACSVLIDLFKEWDVEFDNELSSRLLLGTYTDSLGFTTQKSAILDGAFLIEKGADMNIIEILKYNQPLKMKKYFALLVNSLKVLEINGYKFGISLLSKEDLSDLNLNVGEIRAGPNYLQEIEGMDILCTLAEAEDLIKGSFRSRNYDTLLISKSLGGGGHKLASSVYL